MNRGCWTELELSTSGELNSPNQINSPTKIAELNERCAKQLLPCRLWLLEKQMEMEMLMT